MARLEGMDWAHAALLTIDVQNDFVLADAPSPVGGTLAAIPNMVRLLTAFRTHRRPIVHVVRLYAADGSNAEIGRRQRIRDKGPIVAPGTAGAELVQALRPDPRALLDAGMLSAGRLQSWGEAEWVLYKPRWGAFFQTPLEDHLRVLGVTTVVVCGCNLPNCPRATLFGASERDFHAVLVSDATSQVTQGRLDDLALIDVTVLETDAVIAMTGKDPYPASGS